MKPLRVALLVFLSIVALRARRLPRPTALPRATPESQGVSASAIQEFVDQAEQTIDALHSVVIVRHGRVIAEGWWSPYAADRPHMLFSLSKSFPSTAVGLAIADGKLHLDDAVLDFFPDECREAERQSEGDAAPRLLRCRPAITPRTSGTFRSRSRVRCALFLQMPVSHKPGTHFVYNTPATYMLSAIVQKVTGRRCSTTSGHVSSSR